MAAWEPGCIEKISELKPDIVITDLESTPGWKAANKIGVPYILNCPAGTFSLYQGFWLEKAINYKTQAVNRCGRIVISLTFM